MSARRLVKRLIKFCLILVGVYGGWVLAGSLDRHQAISTEPQVSRNHPTELLHSTTAPSDSESNKP